MRTTSASASRQWMTTGKLCCRARRRWRGKESSRWGEGVLCGEVGGAGPPCEGGAIVFPREKRPPVFFGEKGVPPFFFPRVVPGGPAAAAPPAGGGVVGVPPVAPPAAARPAVSGVVV